MTILPIPRPVGAKGGWISLGFTVKTKGFNQQDFSSNQQEKWDSSFFFDASSMQYKRLNDA